jgi:hypothetical protein
MFLTRFVFVAVCSLFLLSVPPVRGEDVRVSGKIMVGGTPLPSGRIILYPVEDSGQFVGCKIKKGDYAIDRVPAGDYKVTIEGPGLPAIYASEDRTPCKARVRRGSGTIDFNIMLPPS